MIHVTYRAPLPLEFWVHGIAPSGFSDTIAHGEFTSGGYIVDVRLDELGSEDETHCKRIGPFGQLDDAVLAAVAACANDPLFSN